MQRRAMRVAALFAAAAMTVVAPPPRPAAAQTAPAARTFPAVQAFADAAVREGKVPGIAIAIGEGDRPPVWVVAGRIAFAPDAPRAGPDMLWRIYSMTKPVTGIAAMMLVDEGKLRLDQPVSDVFPEFATARVLVDPAKGLETRPAARTITIRDLLTHSSGLDYAILLNTPARRALRDAGVVPLQVNAKTEAALRPLRPATLAEFAARAGRSPLVAGPGTKWSYAMGLDVLAAVVERAGRMPFETFLQRRLFAPLGMTSTGWSVPASQAGRLASNYGPRALIEANWPGTSTPVTEDLVLVDPGAASIYRTRPSFPYGGAGLVSTARDYDRFLQMLLNGGRFHGRRVMSPAAVRLATSNLLPAGVFLTDSGPVPRGEKTGFGAGGFVTLEPVDGFGRHAGTFGWDGAAGTRAWIDPGRRLRATMMINLVAGGALGNDFDKAVARDIAAQR